MLRGAVAVVALVIAGTGPAGDTVNVSIVVAPVPAELFALSAIEYVPAVVGVPLIVGLAKLNPSGSAPTLKLVGELLAVTA